MGESQIDTMPAQESGEEAPPQSSTQPTPSCWTKSAKFIICGSNLFVIVIIVVLVILFRPSKDVILPREREYWNAFHETDKNGDEKLNYEEYKEYVAILNANRDEQLSPEIVTNLFFQLDKSEDKELTWDEAKQAGR